MKADMTASEGWPEIVFSSKDESEVLSSVNLPILPPNTNKSTSIGAESPSNQTQRYHHTLPSQSVNPCMDLVAIISRDVNAPNASSLNGPDPHAGLPPPPPGMSAARSAALMRMRMAQRAKALAAAGIKEPANSQPNSAVQSVIKCASLRLSLWRMSSIAGEQGARVWDVSINVPDRLGNPPEGQSEYEEFSVSTFTWSPDGLYISLVLNIQRRSNSDMQVKRTEQFVLLYALQDGQQIRVVPFNDNGEISGIEWITLHLPDVFNRSKTGSAEDILSLLGPLGEITSVRDDQESKARQRQRLFQAMRDHNKVKIEEERRAKDIVLSDSQGFGKLLSDFPRAMPKRNGIVTSSSSSDTLLPTKASQKETILVARSTSSIHFFLNGVIYLGRANVDTGSDIIESRFDRQDGIVHLIRGQLGEDKLQIDRIPTPLGAESNAVSGLLHIQNLSSFAFELMTYSYDAIVVMRTTYQTLHAECVQIWNRRARLTAKRYATHLPSELLMLLAAGYANDTMMSVLLGNDTLSENNLKKMRNDILSSFTTIESTGGKLISALQRMIVVFEEVLGCALWTEQYGGFFAKQSLEDIRTILKKLADMLRQSNKLTSLVGKEQLAWIHFYRFWLYERARQEALRDGKQAPDAQTIAIAAVGDTPYSVMLLVEFFSRGFYNSSIEKLLDIKMDAKTRGEEVEEDDEDEDGDVSRARETKAAVASNIPTSTEEKSVTEDDDTYSSKRDPWYRDPQLLAKIEETIETLQQKPKVDQLFCTINKKTPTARDFARLSRTEELHVGTASGLADKIIKESIALPSLKGVLIESITIASALFGQAFAGWVQHYGGDKVDGDSKTYSLGGMTISDGRVDGLKSSARQMEGTISINSNAPLIRQCLDNNRADRRSVLVIESEIGNPILLLIVSPSNPSHEQVPMIALANLGQDTKVIDLGFYSSEEVVLLIQHSLKEEKEIETFLVSVRLEELHFKPLGEKLEDHLKSISSNRSPIQAHRCISINNGGGGNAKSLALNRRKEVCATLDDQGHLVYWDLVEQHGVEEKDEEMF